MKTILAIHVLLLLFTLIEAPNTGETSYDDDDDDDDNVPVEFEYMGSEGHSRETSYYDDDDIVPVEIEHPEQINITTEQDHIDIAIIDEFERTVNNITMFSISDEDAEFIKDVKIKYWHTYSSSVDIEFGNETILRSSWINGKPLKLIVHGWRYTKIGEARAFCIKDAYTNSQEYNVITVDWSTIATSKYYFKVARLSAQVGIIIGHLLINLVRIGLVRPSNIHVIGHSIGAHVAAKSGNVFLREMNVMIDRITGLDPSSPGFKDSWFCLWRHTERLDKEDAEFVDVVHTARGVQGISQPIGHVDFYPNNGKSPQPGCEGFNPIEKLHCSHCRSYLYYTESINNPMSFASWKCNSMREFKDENCVKEVINYMGHHANRDDKGKFFLKTNNRSPFSIYFN